MSVDQLWALLQVLLIDISLSGDNAIIIAMAAAGLPASQRKQAIAIGIGAAIVLRIVFAVLTVQLLAVPGLILIGGLMLGWVCWKMFRELTTDAGDELHHHAGDTKTLWQAVLQITIADVSMSLDNVVAVASNLITGLLQRWLWLNYAGLALIVFVSGRMILEGWRAAAPSILATL